MDYYRVRAPNAASTLTAQVWGVGAAALEPRVRVFDALGQAVAAEVLVNDGDSYTVQVRDAVPGADYFVKVEARDRGDRPVPPGRRVRSAGGHPDDAARRRESGTAGGVLADEPRPTDALHPGVRGGDADGDGRGRQRRLLTLAASGETATAQRLAAAGRYAVRVTSTRRVPAARPQDHRPGRPAARRPDRRPVRRRAAAAERRDRPATRRSGPAAAAAAAATRSWWRGTTGNGHR